MLMFCCKPLYLDAANAHIKMLRDHTEDIAATLTLQYLRLFTAASADYEVAAGVQSAHAIRQAKRKDTLRPEYRAAISARTLVDTIKEAAKFFLSHPNLVSGHTVGPC